MYIYLNNLYQQNFSIIDITLYFFLLHCDKECSFLPMSTLKKDKVYCVLIYQDFYLKVGGIKTDMA